VPINDELRQLLDVVSPQNLATAGSGRAAASALFRQQPADFCVTELSDRECSGSGEHAYLWVRKTGQNTAWVAKQLAAFADVGSQAVSYAGLKDRHAVTEQWFSVWLPGRGDPDWSAFASDMDVAGVEILEVHRHSSKLRRGDLTGNRFVITLREAAGDHAALDDRLAEVAETGVPNYFGEQRFGMITEESAGNLELFGRLADGARLSRNKKGFALSAARSALFNWFLNQRVKEQSWNVCLDDDVPLSGRDGDAEVWLAGAEEVPAAIPTGALWGEGGGRLVPGEEALIGRFPEVTAALEKLKVKQHRRSLWLPVNSLNYEWQGADLVLTFELPPGAFATAVLAALLECHDTTA